MTNREQYTELAQQLWLYDVAGNGWPGDPAATEGARSVEDNVLKMQFELTKSIAFDSFQSRSRVREHIAPRFMQYAFRLGRWLDMSIEDISPIESDTTKARFTCFSMGLEDMALASACNANRTLVKYLEPVFFVEPIELPLIKEELETERRHAVSLAAGQLLLAAEIQAERFSFNLPNAFTKSLDN